MSSDEGVDYAFTSVSEVELRRARKVFAMRYIGTQAGPGSVAKHLTAAERDRLWAAGLGIVFLAEGAADSALGGYNTGVQHGEQALAAARALGAPDDLPIYFAVDFDVTAGQWPAAAAYLRGAGHAIGSLRVGIYGGIRAVQWAARDRVAAWFFQTYAWSLVNGQLTWYAGNHVEQYRNHVSLAGGTVDLCRARKANYGQWGSREMAAMTTVLDDPANASALIWRVAGLVAMTDPIDRHVAGMAPEPNLLAQALRRIDAAVAADATRDAAMLAAIQSLAAGGGVDAAPILAAINAAAAQTSAAVAELHDQLAAANATIAHLQARLAAGAQAEAAALNAAG